MTWTDRSSKKNIYGRNSRRILMGSIQRHNHHPCGKTWQWKHHAVGIPWLSKSARTHVTMKQLASTSACFSTLHLSIWSNIWTFVAVLCQNMKKFQWSLYFHKDRVAIILLCSLVNLHPNPYSSTFFSAAGTNSSGTEWLLCCLTNSINYQIKTV